MDIDVSLSGGETHAGQWLHCVQQTAYPPQNEYDVSQGQGSSLVHIQAQSQVSTECWEMLLANARGVVVLAEIWLEEWNPFMRFFYLFWNRLNELL